MTNLRERRRPATGDLGQGAPGLAPEIDDSEWREWPSWWPTPPPRTAVADAAGTIAVHSSIPAAAAASSSSAWPYSGRTPGPMPPDQERLRLVRETRRGLVEAAARAQAQGSGGGDRAGSATDGVGSVDEEAGAGVSPYPGDSATAGEVPVSGGGATTGLFATAGGVTTSMAMGVV
ncbi:unnamed protein product, partial [Ectocarpus sp. 4 AP-2014]